MATRPPTFHGHDDDHDDFGGLHRDLAQMGAVLSRRKLLRVAAGLGVSAAGLSWIGCDTSAAADDTDDASCQTKIPSETAGPYPGDGSNGPNVLNASGVVRSDIRSSFGAYSGTASGVLLTVTLSLVSTASCAALPGYAVYLWHCDAAGNYSLYSSATLSQNYLRGVQAAGADGNVTFTTIFPGCYDGRWPHLHFEVYESLSEATSVSNKIATSQLALPEAACRAVYATAGYTSSLTNLNRVSLTTDGVFRDSYQSQLATTTGSVSAGYTATLTVPV